MNRRILLIDSDTTFRTTLTVAVQKYRLDIVHEPDADEAIATGATEPPDLLVVGVEEPEKAGFKIFQRLKKGPLSKIPIILVTGTVPPDSFLKHKGLKTHAEDYIDKRTISKDELAAKIDALIGLGEHADEDDLDIPVEVDEISMDDGEGAVVEDAPDEYSDQKTRMGGPGVDDGVADDVDDAFAGLMGGGDEPSFDQAPKPAEPVLRTPTTALLPRVPPAVPVPQVSDDGARDFDEMPSTRADLAATMDALRHEGTTAPPPHAEPPQEPEARDEVSVVDSIPARIEDSGRRDDDFDDFHKHSSKDAIGVDDLADAIDEPIDEPIDERSEEAIDRASHHTVATPSVLESQPAIQLDAIDVEVIEDGDLVEDHDSGGVPEPVPHPRSANDAAEAVVVQAQAKLDSQPVMSRTQSIDIGIEQVAEDAEKEQQSGSYPATSEERDQSGVYDRRALRKIGELERQISQLKTEVERARATAETAAKGGGREQTFLNLREKMMSTDTELKKVRQDLGAREHELAELQARYQTLADQQRAIESKGSELEQRLAVEIAKASAAVKKEQELATSVRGLETELGEKADALVATEKVRAQLEAELASERAMRAASASDAERQLRVEREQLVARHQSELTALRQEASEAQEVALEQLRQELEANHANTLAASIEATRGEVGAEAEEAVSQLEAQREADIATLRAEHEESTSRLAADHAHQLARLKNEQAQREADIATLRAEHEESTSRLGADHAHELARLKSDLETAAARTRSDLEQQLATVKTEYETLLAHTKSEFESRLAKTQRELEAQLADAHAQIDAANAKHDEALAQQAAAHAQELAAQANQHAEASAARERELTTARQDDAIAHTAALAELKAELDRAAAKYGLDLDGVRREMDELAALHEANRQEILDEQRAAQARLAEAHADELARVEADKQRALEAITRASAEHKAALERAAEHHRAELVSQREAADREVAEMRQVLMGAKRQMEEAAAAARADREQLVHQHEHAIAEHKAQHERAMAVANGEIIKVKAVADSEHNRATAALKAEHEKERKDRESQYEATLREISTERDELQRGLSGARETIKRNESEHATAVQTIADRNAELRAANAGIAERDARIAELRKEIDAIEAENANYQEQVLRAYQKIKADEAMVARAKKAMAIALTVLDDPPSKSENP